MRVIRRVKMFFKNTLLFIFLLFSYATPLSSIDCNSQKSFHLLHNFNDLKVNGTLKEFSVVSEIECGAVCARKQSCMGFFFSSKDKTCAVYDVNIQFCIFMEYPGMRRYGVISDGEHQYVIYNCYDVMSGCTCCRDGIYNMTSSEMYNLPVYCDMTTGGGGWLLFQRRMDGSEDFYRTWNEYRDGFGNLTGEFWLGNENIHKITKQQTYELRIDLEDFEGNKRYAMYSNFSLDNKENNYKLHIGEYSGDAGDSLSYHNGTPFSAKDKDLDFSKRNCAVERRGGWWYKACLNSNLNGLYLKGENDGKGKGMVWFHWKGSGYSLKTTEMKMRPTSN